MIHAEFRREAQGPLSVRVTGHAGWAEAGSDIVCAAVTSAVQMCANGVTEILAVAAEVSVGENEIVITLPQDPPEAARQMLAALELHLGLLAQDYPQSIELTTLEV